LKEVGEPISFSAGFLATVLCVLLFERVERWQRWFLEPLVFIAIIVPVGWVVLSLGFHYVWFVVGCITGVVVATLRWFKGARK